MSKKTPRPTIDELLPLNPVDFLVLLVLLEGDNYGYGIVKELRDRSDGQIDMLPGNFYTIIQRLTRDGLVEPSPREPKSAPGRTRRLHRITDFGRRVAEAEAMRLEALVKGAGVRDLLERARAR